MMRKKSQNKGNTQKLQVEVDIMEQRIVGLKQILQSQKETTKERMLTSQGSTRWSAASTNVPLRNYGKHVLEKHREVAKTFQQKKKSSKVPSRPSSRSSSLSKQSKQSETSSQSNQSFLSQSLRFAGKNSANENLKRALQLEYTNEVVKFLNSINLEKHAGVILENGFDEMELLKEISVDHLKDMNIPPMDARKLLNRVQKIVETEERQLIQSQKQAQRLKESQSHIEEIANSEIYDEEEQQRLFQEAVMEYRQQQKQQKELKEQAIQHTEEILIEDESLGYISSRQNKKEEQQRNKMKFLLSGANEWKMFDIDYDQTQGTDQQPVIIDKSSCYQCYRLFDQKFAIGNNGREFCSKECLESYKLQNIYLCRSQSCARQIDIAQAFYEIGQWFCNQDCFKQYQWESVNIRGRTHISL
ncbi:unnamed protein product (macronuclear) [Paramecium tetraurelia]|uniref:SAM domain-containing protein n=1 Tax=Paramecium tetraurelia TaxID=5888 RepID=A0C5Q3_PARTE|nr:uncharacterized protein GSPATT00035249001 [Paramecium tetraurelia]CAK66120.1 unnamed protein product [Paramecium tetraurelia]|eukprot:XP_001433517.1 hypothetical protein (macronuclear) [Paramecium tetraurelia strain d4-2]